MHRDPGFLLQFSVGMVIIRADVQEVDALAGADLGVILGEFLWAIEA